MGNGWDVVIKHRPGNRVASSDWKADVFSKQYDINLLKLPDKLPGRPAFFYPHGAVLLGTYFTCTCRRFLGNGTSGACSGERVSITVSHGEECSRSGYLDQLALPARRWLKVEGLNVDKNGGRRWKVAVESKVAVAHPFPDWIIKWTFEGEMRYTILVSGGGSRRGDKIMGASSDPWQSSMHR